jgi:hypothetical protein
MGEKRWSYARWMSSRCAMYLVVASLAVQYESFQTGETSATRIYANNQDAALFFSKCA